MRGILFVFLVCLALSTCLVSINSNAINPLGFTSSPAQSLQPLERYNYTPICNDVSATLTMSSNAEWLVLFNGTIIGRPVADDIGIYLVNLTFSSSTEYAYQNYTIDVRWVRNVTPSMQTDLLIGLTFGFGLIGLSLVDMRHRIWPTFAGLAWLIISVVAFYPIGLGWMVLGVGIGLIMWIEGAMEYAASRRQGT